MSISDQSKRKVQEGIRKAGVPFGIVSCLWGGNCGILD